MRYADAFKIGSKIEGVIQCTYATIYDAAGNGLFSLQRTKKTLTGNWLYEWRGDDVYFDNQGDRSYVDAEIGGGITVELPMVQATEYSTDTLVPAKLTYEAVDIISNALRKMKRTRYTIYRVADYDTPKQNKGERVVVRVQYYTVYIDEWNRNNNDHRYHYEVEVEPNVIIPRYQKLIEILESGETVYVRPAAFRWTPLDGINATITGEDGVEIKLSDALEKAKQRYENAKAILAAAGAFAIM